MPTSTVENYIKHLYLMQSQREDGLVSMGDLASAVGVVPGTATTMIKTLAESGLVNYEPRVGVSLSASGEKLALHVLRRHRLVELFLVEIIGMDWSEIHDEAEDLEHVISDRLLERIDAMLGHPSFDPHGDPIPSAQGKISRRDLVPLVRSRSGRTVRIARVLDQGETFLQFLDEKGLRPGRNVVVTRLDAIAGVVHLQSESGEAISLGFGTAAKIEIEDVE